MKQQSKAIKHFILKKIAKHPSDIVAITTDHFRVTRTTVHRHLNALLKAHRIVKSGTTRSIQYHLASASNREMYYRITPDLEEAQVLKNDFDDVFRNFSENIYDICTYGFTEIFNNAIEHSKGIKITASTHLERNILSIAIMDDGIGIFKKITDFFHLDDIRESVLQLNKGKMTTDPSNHTGEGVFFCSRVFDVFEIYANKIHYLRDNRESDWSLENVSDFNVGSRVVMSVDINSDNYLTDVFKQFQAPESLAFSRTEIVVELSKFDEETLISRSQAKRVTRNLEKFDHVILDFKKVRLVGQGFVDEIFRVFLEKHPSIEISYINANKDVTFMIQRGL